jgi:thioredoxin-like negative regulator of GroEL
MYQKLEKSKGYKFPGYAVYKQAYAYFQLNDTTTAQNLAQKAATMAGNQKIDAKILYADTWYKLGDYQRAKDFYLGLRDSVAKDKTRMNALVKKIALCNQKLKKPERDGL